MVRSYRIKAGDNMLPQKKVSTKSEKINKDTKKPDVAKAISKSNKKHAKMMKMLAQ